MKRPGLGLWISMLVMANAIAPAAGAAVAVLEQVMGNPRIFEMGEAGAREVSLPRRGAEYDLPIDIETGAADSAVFRLPDGTISVAPHSIMRVAAPEPRRGSLLQRVFHRSGSALFSVDRRDSEHFEVETPYLVSVVKGTLFSVVVHDDGATVSLHEGLLEVASADGSRRVTLHPGEVAFSNQSRELQKLESTRASAASTGDADGRAATARPDLNAVSTELDGDHARADDTPVRDDLALDLDDTLADLTFDEADGDNVAAVVATTDARSLDDVETIDVIEAGDDMLEDGGLIADVGDTTGDLAGELLGDTDDTAGDLLGEVGDAAADLTDDLADTTDDLTDTADDLTGTADDLTDTVADTTGDVIDTTGELIDTTGDVVADAGEELEDVVRGLLRNGDLLGGLDP